MKSLLIIVGLLLACLSVPAQAQTSVRPCVNIGAPPGGAVHCQDVTTSNPLPVTSPNPVNDQSTTNLAGTITTGNTFQQLQAASTTRKSLTIQNNNTNGDNCWLFIGATASATAAKSILLAQGQSYSRYFPYIPSDNLAITCAANNDTFYADVQ